MNTLEVFNIGVFLAALGITLLEMSEASAVGIALYADSKQKLAFASVVLGVLIIMIPTAVAGNFIALFPLFYVRLASATLLLYFGIRLIRSARRSMKFQRMKSSFKKEERIKGIFSTGVSVGAVEAFEAAIVLIALFPESYDSTFIGLIIGACLVVGFAYLLKTQVRKVKQASMKVAVSALLLTFASFWYIEAFKSINDLFLVPFFVVYFLVVYYIASYKIPKAVGD